MTNPTLALGTYDNLLCPFCGNAELHIERVNVGARKEDRPAYLISIDAVAGTVEESPAYEELSSRRQWVELLIDCEQCPGGSLVLAQHKGLTLVSLREPTTNG